MSNPQIVVAGHICLDIIPTFDPSSTRNRIEPGQLYDVGPALFSTGGAVSNTGIALHRLGVPTRLIGKVANDAFGQHILSILRAIDPALADGMTVVEEGPSSYSVVISPPGVDRSFLHCPGTNDSFTAGDVDSSLIEGTKLFHFGYPPVMREFYRHEGREMQQLLATVKAAGVTTSLDMCVPDPESESGQLDWRRWLTNVLPHVDLFLPSIDEIAFMLGHDATTSDESLWRTVADDLIALGASIVMLKLGEQGLYLRTASAVDSQLLERDWSNVELHAPCFEVDVAGTTGAGDCTIAGFLAAYVEGLLPEECLTTAVAVGACSVEAADATSGVRPLTEVRERLRTEWAAQ